MNSTSPTSNHGNVYSLTGYNLIYVCPVFMFVTAASSLATGCKPVKLKPIPRPW